MLLDECYVSFLNLSHRKDRLKHMQEELARVGINATRTPGKLPHEYDLNNPKFQVMKNRTPGAIGCWSGMIEIAKEALLQNKHAFIMEDDLIFCNDIHKRLSIIDDFDKQYKWDVIWLGGTVHINPHHWHTGTNPDLLGSDLGRDCEYIGHKYLYRSYGSFSTHAWLLNKNSIQKVINMLDAVQHEAMGIDWAHIKISYKLLNYVFLPGCIIQKDNKSDIGFGDTIFSGFRMLGQHWFTENLEDFNHDTYNWGEVKSLTTV